MVLNRTIAFQVLTLLIFHLSSHAQVFKPIKWSFSTEQIGKNEYYLVFTAKADKGWTVYSQYTSDEGPVPTGINYEEKSGIKLEGKSTESGHKKEGPDKLFDNVTVIKFLYDKPFVIKQKVKVTDAKKPVTGYVTYMTCNDERCLPPVDEDFKFDFEKPIGSNAPTTLNAQDKNDKGSPEENKPTIVINKINSGTSASQEIQKNVDPLQPVAWTYNSTKVSDDDYDLIFTASIQKGWNVYSMYTADGGPIPTTINFEAKEGIQILNKATESGSRKQGKDKMFEGVTVIKFLADKPYTITQRIKINDVTKPISGYLTYVACDDSKCLPPTDVNFQFNFNPSGSASDYVSTANISNDEIDQLIPSLFESYKNPKSQCGDKKEIKTGYFWTFLFGFLGGLFALLTPCVFPMIPITVSFFTKDTKRKGWVNGLIYGLSIIAIYVTLGLIITGVFGPEALNRLSTNWIANSLFFIIFIFFAFSFFGYYEITLPSSWSTKSDQMADKGGLVGIFFMAFTLALVSFSCTGPIIGTALVQAAGKGQYIGPFIVMFGFSFALALPFGLFAAFPAWLNTLPKSGSWMNSVKVVLGFLELALAFKFLSVADLTNHWGVLKYEAFMGIWVVVFLCLAIYLWGFIKFPHDSPLKKLTPLRIAFAVLATVSTIYLASGFRYNETTKSYHGLSLMSGLAPPSHYNFFLKEAEVDAKIKSKYMSYTKCANDIPCFKDYYEGLSYAREMKKPILIDFTGHGCVNCRKTEEHIWVADKVRNMLTHDVVLISLYVDDDKKLDNALVSKNSKKKMRNVGNLWADFQIVNFEQNSQPLYVLVNTDQEVLASPRGYQEGVDDYYNYLKCGMKGL